MKKTLLAAVLATALISAVLLIRYSQVGRYREDELADVANGNSLLRSYSKESKMINEPMDAEDGSLYNAPFR